MHIHKELKAGTLRGNCTPTFVAALFTISQKMESIPVSMDR